MWFRGWFLSLILLAMAGCTTAPEFVLETAVIEQGAFPATMRVSHPDMRRAQITIPTYGSSCVEPGWIEVSWRSEREVELRPRNWVYIPPAEPRTACPTNIVIRDLTTSIPLLPGVDTVLVRAVGLRSPGGVTITVERVVVRPTS